MPASATPVDVQPTLRILLASTQRQWHGGESQAALLAVGLRQRGHECLVLARRDGDFAERMRTQGFPVVEFARRGRSLGALLQIRRSIQQFAPDVLHANDAHALRACGLASLGLPVQVRVVARRVDFPVRFASHYRRAADGVICVSRAVREVCLKSGLPASLLHLVHDGVPPEFAKAGSRTAGRSSLGLAEDQPLLLTVAKLTDHKGHAYLLRAMADVRKRFPRAVLALAGDGELRGELEAATDTLGIRSHVKFLGYRHDIPDLLAAADVAVQPSHLEGLCSSLIDAMFAARPIVATTAGGIPDLFEQRHTEGPCGWLVPPKSPTELHAAICAALDDRREAQRRGQRARQHAQQHFTASVMVEKTLEVYQQIHDQKLGTQAAPVHGWSPSAA